MSRDVIPLRAPDVALFARALGRQIAAQGPAPSHLELLNMLARAAGFRNHQHLRAAHAAGGRLEAGPPPAEACDFRLVERALNHFDAAGLLSGWPARRQLQELCLWTLWAAFPRGEGMAERQVNAFLNARHGFGDPAILRRDLCGLGLLTRKADGSDYRRVERRPGPEARDLIRRVAERRAG